MQIFPGRSASEASQSRDQTFTGQIWADQVMPPTDGVTINNVFFPPNARTYWHTHGQGQILQVLAGQGWICVKGGKAKVIRTGDTIWIPADEVHWHGAAADSYLLHTATSLGGTFWDDEVTADQFQDATS